jgi:hypothetical protein
MFFQYKEDIKDVAKHVCYCYQKLHFKYQSSIISKPYIENFPNELKNEKKSKRCNNM